MLPPFMCVYTLSFMAPSFPPSSWPPNLATALCTRGQHLSPLLWGPLEGAAHASQATRCLLLLDALASVLVPPPSLRKKAEPLDHRVFTQPPFEQTSWNNMSFPCLLVDPKAVAATSHMELSKGYLRLWLTTHTSQKGSRLSEYAHRLVLWAIQGPPNEAHFGGWAGAVAMHKCHNPLCVHPCHLKWGTRRENFEDRPPKAHV